MVQEIVYNLFADVRVIVIEVAQGAIAYYDEPWIELLPACCNERNERPLQQAGDRMQS